MMTLETLVITPATNGRELMDLLSEEETSCMQGVVGDGAYQLMLGAPVVMFAGAAMGGDAESAFGYLVLDNILLLGVALVSSESGGYTPDTRSCLVDVAREYPEAVLVNLGMEIPDRDAASAVESHPYIVELYNCLNDANVLAPSSQ